MKDLFGYVYTLRILSYIYIVILVLSILGILFLWIPILALRIKRDWNLRRVDLVRVWIHIVNAKIMASCFFLTVFSTYSLVLVTACNQGYGLLLIFLFQLWYSLLLCNIHSLLDQFKSVPASRMQDLYNEFKHCKLLWTVCWTLQRDFESTGRLVFCLLIESIDTCFVCYSPIP